MVVGSGFDRREFAVRVIFGIILIFGFFSLISVGEASGLFLGLSPEGTSLLDSFSCTNALNARFNEPSAIAVAGDGKVYIADTSNNQIRVWDRGEVYTLAGTGVEGYLDGHAKKARFNDPRGIVIGPDGNLYVSDTGNRRVRMISRRGVVSTEGGDGGYIGMLDVLHGPALNVSMLPLDLVVAEDVPAWPGKNVFFINPRNVKVMNNCSGDWVVYGLAGHNYYSGYFDGSAGSRFNELRSISFDGDRNFYVADSGNHRIRKVSWTGGVTTYAGYGYVSGNPAGGSVDGTSSDCMGYTNDCDARVYSPLGLEITSTGDLFFVGGDHLLRRMSGINKYITTFAGEAGVANFTDCRGGGLTTTCIMNGLCEVVPGDGDLECNANLDCVCGNGVCDSSETAVSCALDCSCGDGICDLTENSLDCYSDCHCGDGICC